MSRQDELESSEKRPRTIIDSHEARKETPIWCFASFGQSWIDSNCESLVEGSILAGDCGWGRRGGRRHPRDRDHQDITLLVTTYSPHHQGTRKSALSLSTVSRDQDIRSNQTPS
jgi:hypothetical protein